MGNCQAIDSATLVIQHPNGRVDRLYSPVSAKQIMKINPGHYVALLLTTTLYSSTAAAAAAAAAKNNGAVNNNTTPLRVTRIKLLRPTDTLLLGHVYRLVTSQGILINSFLLFFEKRRYFSKTLLFNLYICSCRSNERAVGKETSEDAAATTKDHNRENKFRF